MHSVYADTATAGTRAFDEWPKKGKSKHPVLKVMGIVLAIMIVVCFSLFVADEMKSNEQRLADYTGTWQACSISQKDDPVRMTVAFFANQGTGIGDNFVMGISDGRAQMSAFGIMKGYSFELNGKEGVFRNAEGTIKLNAKIQFGHMIVTDTSGVSTVYKKTSDRYILVDEQANNVDTAALEDVAKMLMDVSGFSADVEVFDIVDEQALSEKLQNVDPETLQQVIGNIDMGAVATGDYENIIDESDPAVQELIASVGAEAAADGELSIEEGFAIAEQYGISEEEARELAAQYGYEIP